MIQKLRCWSLCIGIRSETVGSGFEKEFCTLLMSKSRNDPSNISHAPKWPQRAKSWTPEKSKVKIGEQKLYFQAVIKSAASAAFLKTKIQVRVLP